MNKSFRWEEFVRVYKIDFVDSGKNVARGEINIKSPFCGHNDPSHHMALSTTKGMPFWHCWRVDSHKGRSPYRLIKKLLRCSHSEVLEILGKDVVDAGEFSEILKNVDTFFDSGRPKKIVEDLKIPDDFIPIGPTGETKRFRNYLVEGRGFLGVDVDKVIRRYGLLACSSGYWSNRLIIPIKFNSELVCWTARSLGPSQVRYLSLSNSDGFKQEHGYKASVSIKDTLYNFDKAFSFVGDCLFVVEGPLDCIKFDFYSKDLGCRAVGMFNMVPSKTQLRLLQLLSENYEKIVIMLDKGEDLASTELMSELSFLRNVKQSNYLEMLSVKDPGDLTKKQVESICTKETS